MYSGLKWGRSFPPSSQKITFQLNPSVVLLVCLFVFCLFILPSVSENSSKHFKFICSLALSVVLFACLSFLPLRKHLKHFICSLALSLVLLAAAIFATYSYANHRNKYMNVFFKIGRIIIHIVRIICFVFHRNRCANQNLWILCLK